MTQRTLVLAMQTKQLTQKAQDNHYIVSCANSNFGDTLTLCVCMPLVCVSCTHTHTHTQMCTHAYTHTHTNVHSRIHTHIQSPHADTHKNIHSHTHIQIYPYKYNMHAHVHTLVLHIFSPHTQTYDTHTNAHYATNIMDDCTYILEVWIIDVCYVISLACFCLLQNFRLKRFTFLLLILKFPKCFLHSNTELAIQIKSLYSQYMCMCAAVLL